MTTPSTPSDPNISVPTLRIAWLFQGLVAAPTAFVLGVNVFDTLLSSYYLDVYRFVSCTFNGLLAAAIVFIVILQWSLSKHGALNLRLTYGLEVSKAVIASAMWIWLLLDSILYTMPYYYGGTKAKRIAISAISVVLVLALFYPTAIYAWYIRKEVGTQSQDTVQPSESTTTPATENTPLLT